LYGAMCRGGIEILFFCFSGSPKMMNNRAGVSEHRSPTDYSIQITAHPFHAPAGYPPPPGRSGRNRKGSKGDGRNAAEKG